MNRKQIDAFFKYLFRIVSLVSILALGAILLFVFIQGIMPFLTPTARGIQIVPQRISELTINGTVYQDTSSIELPGDTTAISIRFSSAPFSIYEEDEETYEWDWDDEEEEADEITAETVPADEEPVVAVESTAEAENAADEGLAAADTGDGGETVLEITVNRKEKNPDRILNFTVMDGELSNPEAYVYTVSWPGIIAAMTQRIHVILPEPPYSPWAFISGLHWQPVKDKLYGIFPMIAGTILASLLAIIMGVPAALLCAVFMAEFLPDKAAALLRSGIELLAGIPSVVYGFFGLMVVVPAVKAAFHIPSGNTLLSASLVLALMILPTVITIAETSIRAVPLSLREASLSLGASKMQTAWRVALPHAQSGVVAGIILGISRAVGETMAVILVAGNSPHLVGSPLESIRTLTATIAMEMGYASGRHSEMLFSIGVVLFTIILFLNGMILRFRRRMELS